MQLTISFTKRRGENSLSFSINLEFPLCKFEPSSRVIGKISAQPHTIVKQICLPNGNLLFLSLFSLSKN